MSWIAWEQLASVTQENIDLRGLVFAHAWTFRSTGGTTFSVVYPAGALPWPGTMLREIRRRAPHVRGV